jgi:hypothetical protein
LQNGISPTILITKNNSSVNAKDPQVVSFYNQVYVFWANTSTVTNKTHFSYVMSNNYGQNFTGPIIDIHAKNDPQLSQNYSDLVIKINKVAGHIVYWFVVNDKIEFKTIVSPALSCKIHRTC